MEPKVAKGKKAERPMHRAETIVRYKPLSLMIELSSGSL